MVLLLQLILASSCIIHLDSELAHWDFYENAGQVIEDVSGNKHHLIMGENLNTEINEGLPTERGIYFWTNNYLKSGKDIITESELLLPEEFTITLWVLFKDDKGLLFGKDEKEYEFYLDNEGNYVVHSEPDTVEWKLQFEQSGKIEAVWYFLATSMEKISDYSDVILYRNEEQSNTYSITTFTDNSSTILVIGTGKREIKFNGFLYEMIIYDEIIPSVEFVSNNNLFYTDNYNCEVYPIHKTECMGTCIDETQTEDCEDCGDCETCMKESRVCIECEENCYFCYIGVFTCEDMFETFCNPYTFNDLEKKCNFDETMCIDNCETCVNETECVTCISGYFLESDLTCGSTCEADEFGDTDTFSCEPCHENCATCEGPYVSDCLTCSETHASIDETTNECECEDGYYESSSSPQYCSLCHPQCSTCTGNTEFDCIECAETHTSVNDTTGECECNEGFYSSSYDSLECTQCDQDCLTCDGAGPTNCLDCSDNNASIQNSECECNEGFFESSSSPLVCSVCDEDCSSCDCISCADLNAYLNNTSNLCICNEGYFEESRSPLVCITCNEKCSSCREGKCEKCEDSNAIVNEDTGICECLENFFESETGCICEEPNKIYNEECSAVFECEGVFIKNSKVGVECESEVDNFYPDFITLFLDNNPAERKFEEVNSTLVYFSFEYSNQKEAKIVLYEYTMSTEDTIIKNNTIYIELEPEEEEFYSEEEEMILEDINTSTATSIALNAMAAMFLLEDPSVSWTIINTSELISYMGLFDVNISVTLFNFLRSFQLGGVIPNILVEIWDPYDEEVPEKFENYGKKHCEFEDLNVLRNTGRQIIVVVSVLIFLLILFLVKTICCFENARRWISKNLYNFWSKIIRLWMVLCLDFGIAATLQLWNFSENYTVGFSIFLLSIFILFPFFLGYKIWKNKELIRNENKEFQNYYGTLFEEFKEKSLIGALYNIVSLFRRIHFCVFLICLGNCSHLFCVSNMVVSSGILLILLRAEFKKFIAKVVFILSELDIFFTIWLISLQLEGYFEEKHVEYCIILINISMILLSTLLVIGNIIYKIINRKKNVYQINPQQNFENIPIRPIFELNQMGSEICGKEIILD